MKKWIITACFAAMAFTAQAQLKIGLKAGANFSNVEASQISTKTRTGFHFGAIAELKLPGRLALQPELLYSSQGADVTTANVRDINYDYLTVPVLAKIYLLPDILSVDLGPQFSFLINDNIPDNDFNLGNSATFDFALLGGLGLDLGSHLFLQGRYVLGLTDASTKASVNNRVIQLSLGYKF